MLAEAPNGTPDVILIGTGSEVQLAVAARETLAAEGINARVVSAPSLEWFAEQDEAYRESRAPGSPSPPACPSRPASHSPGAASSATRGRSVSIEHFGASADYKTLFQKFGITAEAVVEAARETVAAAQRRNTKENTHEHPHRAADRRGRQHLAGRPLARAHHIRQPRRTDRDPQRQRASRRTRRSSRRPVEGPRLRGAGRRARRARARRR